MLVRFMGSGNVYRIVESDKTAGMLRLVPRAGLELDEILVNTDTLLRMVEDKAVEEFTEKMAIEEIGAEWEE